MARAAQSNSVNRADVPSLQPGRSFLNTLFPPFPCKRKPDMAFNSPSSNWGASLDATDPSFPQMRETAGAYSPSFPHKPESADACSPSSPHKPESAGARRPSFPRKRESIFAGAYSPSLPHKRMSAGAHSSSFPRKRESIFAGAAADARTNNLSSLPHSLSLMRRTACLFFGILLFLFLFATVGAAENGVITGTVINGTAGGSAPADVAVTLYYLRNGEIVEQRTQVTDAVGAYRFTDISTEPALTFVVVAAYEQVPYNTPEPAIRGDYGDPSAATRGVRSQPGCERGAGWSPTCCLSPRGKKGAACSELSRL